MTTTTGCPTMTTTTPNADAAAVAVDWLPINPDIVPLQGWHAINPDVGGRHSYLIEYYKACRAGAILVGRELQTTLEGLIQDILYRSDKYRFDLAPAHKRINFIEKEVKHFEAPFAGKPFKLALCQKAIAEAIFGFYRSEERRVGKEC